jgi:hypothetical protein
MNDVALWIGWITVATIVWITVIDARRAHPLR